MAFNWKNLVDPGRALFGDEDKEEAEEKTKQARAKREEATKLASKSVSEFQKEGRAAAGQAASDKAGIAKRQAKASIMQSGGNRLQAATNAASAAQDASTEEYDTTSQAMTNAAQAQNAAQVAALNNEASGLQKEAEEAQKRSQNRKNRIVQAAGAAMTLLSSDCRKKHVYIPKEDRK